jgi:hypothetical protein
MDNGAAIRATLDDARDPPDGIEAAQVQSD